MSASRGADSHHLDIFSDRPSPVARAVNLRFLAESSRASESPRKRAIRRHAEEHCTERTRSPARNAYYHERDATELASLVRPGSSVLELGCGSGRLLARLDARRPVGIDLSEEMIRRARVRLPDAELYCGDVEERSVLDQVTGTFDYVILSDTLGLLDDCDETLGLLHRFCRRETRLIIAHHSWIWEPVLRVAEWTGAKMRQPELNWLATDDICGLLDLAGFRAISVRRKILCPIRLLGLGPLIDRSLADLPIFRNLCLRHYVIARSAIFRSVSPPPSLTVVVPCRNEKGNIEPAVLRTPKVCQDQEILFVEGHSQDGTWEEILRVQTEYPEHRIRAIQQPGVGKADAVWSAFDVAHGDVLLILDGDLTVPPESLPKFYRAIADGVGEFVMGTRMVYPVERTAMRFLNYWANRVFALLFSWMLRQRITDTLCGTKVIFRESYRRLKADGWVGDDDPFGDFGLICGAAAQSLEIRELPIRYAPRAYGETQISRFRHGWMLARMVFSAYRKL